MKEEGIEVSEEKLRHRFINSMYALRSFARRVGNGRFRLENDDSQEILAEVAQALEFLDSYPKRAQELMGKSPVQPTAATVDVALFMPEPS